MNKHIFLIAVTGGAASGKTTVCKLFQELGIKTINSDILAREAVIKDSPAYKDIVNHFGENILFENGDINRSELRKIIVQDENARKKLEYIVHPHIFSLMAEKITEISKTANVTIVEVPLLFETGLEKYFNEVILVLVDNKTKIKRLTARDNVSEKDAASLLTAQMSDDEKIKKSNFIIYNDGSVENLKITVDKIFKKIKNKEKTP
ncbi:MAG: dephospho-CoA kinase [Desulfobacterales bacterium]|nr:dephospho-CoA kinase [Desulfobacterales bacterium]